MRDRFVVPPPARGACARLGAPLLVLIVGLMLLTPAATLAGPVFALPGGPVHVPGFVMHLPPIGPVPLAPGVPVGPILYGDAMPNPLDPHHWEIEINNTNPVVTAFNVVITSPAGGAFAGNVTLAPGWSAYWDVHYADVPEVGGPWTFNALNPAGSPYVGLLLDSDVIEYNFPVTGLGPAGPIFAGPAGGFGAAGPLIPGVMPISLTVAAPVPVPAAAWLGLGLLGSLGTGRALRRWRRCAA